LNTKIILFLKRPYFMSKTVLHFTKAQALGNDFIIADNLSQYSNDVLQFLANRCLGVGCDQLISLEENTLADDVDFVIRFYNADGSWAGACGNGSRAVAGYWAEKHNKEKVVFAVQHPAGGYALVSAKISRGHCALQMQPPAFKAKFIPLSQAQLDTTQISLPDILPYSGFCVNVGNPHIVFIVDDVDNVPITQWGPLVETHDLFPEKTNVEFVQVFNRRHLRMRVWERGAGLTQACGTGACASAIAAIHKGLCDEDVQVDCDGGRLQIYYHHDTQTLMLSGGYHIVFSGEIIL
jgi:diaminopimelate epimerase